MSEPVLIPNTEPIVRKDASIAFYPYSMLVTNGSNAILLAYLQNEADAEKLGKFISTQKYEYFEYRIGTTIFQQEDLKFEVEFNTGKCVKNVKTIYDALSMHQTPEDDTFASCQVVDNERNLIVFANPHKHKVIVAKLHRSIDRKIIATIRQFINSRHESFFEARKEYRIEKQMHSRFQIAGSYSNSFSNIESALNFYRRLAFIPADDPGPILLSKDFEQLHKMFTEEDNAASPVLTPQDFADLHDLLTEQEKENEDKSLRAIHDNFDSFAGGRVRRKTKRRTRRIRLRKKKWPLS